MGGGQRYTGLFYMCLSLQRFSFESLYINRCIVCPLKRGSRGGKSKMSEEGLGGACDVMWVMSGDCVLFGFIVITYGLMVEAEVIRSYLCEMELVS